MPAYLCHGFRWHRLSVKYLVILQDIDDAATEWIVAPKSAEAILETFYSMYDFIPPCAQSRAADSLKTQNALTGPNADMYKVSIESGSDEERRGRLLQGGLLKDKRSLSSSRKRSMSTSRLRKPGKRPETLPVPPRPMQVPPPLFSPMPPDAERNRPFNEWSSVKMLEEYDPANELVLSNPWAYLADYVVRIDTSVSPLEEMRQYEERMKAEKFKAMSGPSDETGRKPSTKGSKNAGWLEKLRDQVQENELIKWYVVICGDENRTFPTADKEDSLGGRRNGKILEDEFEFRLPEFDNYGYNRKSAVVQPLRLRKYDGLTPPPVPRFPQFIRPPSLLQNQTPEQSLFQSRTPRSRPQTQPASRQPILRKPSLDRPPAVPTKDLGEYTPPPDPLANLRDVGSRKMAMDRPSIRKSTMNIRKLFSKKQFENYT